MKNRQTFRFRQAPIRFAGVAGVVAVLVGIGLLILALTLGLIFALVGAVLAAGWLLWRKIARLFGDDGPQNRTGPVIIEGRYRVVERQDERNDPRG